MCLPLSKNMPWISSLPKSFSKLPVFAKKDFACKSLLIALLLLFALPVNYAAVISSLLTEPFKINNFVLES